MTPRRILVTGGQRSGKSRYAESLLANARRVTYLAPGAPADSSADPEWAARIAAHQARRPAGWTTVESPDAAAALRAATPPLLLDCLGTWLTALVDGLGAWDQPLPGWRGAFEHQLGALVDAWRGVDGLAVAVTNEVGWGLVSEHRSGRVFTDLLGEVNQQLAAASDEVVLVVAGRALKL
jgi:adenosylcobinamide kinase/adenosylcobinamide-phosphate guanylyltransferase